MEREDECEKIQLIQFYSDFLEATEDSMILHALIELWWNSGELFYHMHCNHNDWVVKIVVIAMKITLSPKSRYRD